MIGAVLIHKPKGITSHDVVARLRRTLKIKRIGHSGTLDPLASGLLVLAVGPATRFLQYMPLEPKEYVVKVRFGEVTPSYDAETEVTETRPVPDDLEQAIAQNIAQFQGLIEQIPPMFSAVKKEGRPLYELARNGVDVVREARRIYIESFQLTQLDGVEATFRIVCSGGTYVRSLAHDLGQAIGCGGHVVELRRTRIGRFLDEDAVEAENCTPEHVMPLHEVLPPMPFVLLNQDQLEHVRHGRVFQHSTTLEHRHIAMISPIGDVIGIAKVNGNKLQPDCVLPFELPSNV